MNRNNYATFSAIKTKTISVQGNKGEQKKAKLFITLTRGKDFFENMEKFNKVREDQEAAKRLEEEATKKDEVVEVTKE